MGKLNIAIPFLNGSIIDIYIKICKIYNAMIILDLFHFSQRAALTNILM